MTIGIFSPLNIYPNYGHLYFIYIKVPLLQEVECHDMGPDDEQLLIGLIS